MPKHVRRIFIETCDDEDNWEIIAVPYGEQVKQQELAVVSLVGGKPLCATTTKESAEKTMLTIDESYSRNVPGPSLYDYAELILKEMEAKNV